MKKLTVLFLLVASFAQAQLLTEPASYTVLKSGSGIKLASNKGLIKFFTSPVVTGEPRAIYPLNLASVKFTQNGFTTEVPWTYVVNVGGSTAALTLSGLVDQLTALVSSTGGVSSDIYTSDKSTQASKDSLQSLAIDSKLPFVSSAASLTASNITSATYDGSIWDLETSPLSPDNVTVLPSKQAGYVWRRRYTYVSVKWKCFAGGAKGDGVTDDIAAINAATLYAKGRGTTVYFPTGTYIIGGTMYQYRGVRLLGEGYVWDSNCTKIKLKNGANCVMLKAGRAIQNIDTNDASFMSIEGIMFDGNGMNQTAENEGVQFWGQYVGSSIKNVFIAGVFGHALSLQSGLDLKIDHLWLLGNQSSDGYGMVANQSLSSGQDGYLNMDHVYVEFQIKSSTPINVYSAPLSKRGVGMYLNRVITTNANELHFEYNAGGILFQDCFAANIGNVGVFSIGNGTDPKPGVIQLYQGDAVKSLSIHKGIAGGDVLGAVKWVSILNGTSNEVMEGPLLNDRQVLSGYISSATGSSPKPSLFYSPESVFANRIALQKVNGASPQSVDFLASDGTNAAGLHSHDFDFRIGSSRYQPGGAFKNFLTINSYGGNGDNVAFGVQTTPVNLTATSGLQTGANFRYNGVPSYFDGTNVLSHVTSTAGTAAPTSTPGWAGQTYVDATNNVVYTATGSASSANWFALNLWANIKNRPTSLSQFTNDLGYGTMATQSANNVSLTGGLIGGNTTINISGLATTQAVSGTTTNGTNLLSITQNGTGRALYVQRSVANAARPMVTLASNVTNGAQPVLVLQQDDSSQPALQATNSGGSISAAIYGDGRILGASLSLTGGITSNNKTFGTYPLTATLSGNGNTTAFTVAHGLGYTPTFVAVHPNSSDASGIKYSTVDATNVTINYTTAPPGTGSSNNLVFSIELR